MATNDSGDRAMIDWCGEIVSCGALWLSRSMTYTRVSMPFSVCIPPFRSRRQRAADIYLPTYNVYVFFLAGITHYTPSSPQSFLHLPQAFMIIHQCWRVSISDLKKITSQSWVAMNSGDMPFQASLCHSSTCGKSLRGLLRITN